MSASDGEIITVHGGEPGLPPGLFLNGPMRALRFPDGRLRLLDLPPDLENRLYPDAQAPATAEEPAATKPGESAEASTLVTPPDVPPEPSPEEPEASPAETPPEAEPEPVPQEASTDPSPEAEASIPAEPDPAQDTTPEE